MRLFVAQFAVTWIVAEQVRHPRDRPIRSA
jgi:hypothetical protein